LTNNGFTNSHAEGMSLDALYPVAVAATAAAAAAADDDDDE